MVKQTSYPLIKLKEWTNFALNTVNIIVTARMVGDEEINKL